MRVEPVEAQETLESSFKYVQDGGFQIPLPLSQPHPGVIAEYPFWGKAVATAAIAVAVPAVAACAASRACAALVASVLPSCVIPDCQERNFINPNALRAISRMDVATAGMPLRRKDEVAARGARGRGAAGAPRADVSGSSGASTVVCAASGVAALGSGPASVGAGLLAR